MNACYLAHLSSRQAAPVLPVFECGAVRAVAICKQWQHELVASPVSQGVQSQPHQEDCIVSA